MAGEGTLLPIRKPLAFVDAATEATNSDAETLATRDPEVIRRWAERRDAEPATGEGPGPRPIVDVNDGDAGIRFNFPGFARYRSISWDA